MQKKMYIVVLQYAQMYVNSGDKIMNYLRQRLEFKQNVYTIFYHSHTTTL